MPRTIPNQFEKYCENCKTYSWSSFVIPETCSKCNSPLKIVVICKTCKQKYTVTVVDYRAKCQTCNTPLRLNYYATAI